MGFAVARLTIANRVARAASEPTEVVNKATAPSNPGDIAADLTQAHYSSRDFISMAAGHNSHITARNND
jgi:hypothetical protein